MFKALTRILACQVLVSGTAPKHTSSPKENACSSPTPSNWFGLNDDTCKNTPFLFNPSASDYDTSSSKVPEEIEAEVHEEHQTSGVAREITEHSVMTDIGGAKFETLESLIRKDSHQTAEQKMLYKALLALKIQWFFETSDYSSLSGQEQTKVEEYYSILHTELKLFEWNQSYEGLKNEFAKLSPSSGIKQKTNVSKRLALHIDSCISSICKSLPKEAIENLEKESKALHILINFFEELINQKHEL